MNIVSSALMSLAVSAAVAIPGATTVPTAEAAYDPPPVNYDNGNPSITRTVEVIDTSTAQPDYRRPLTSCDVRSNAATCALKQETALTNSLEWKGGVSTADVEASVGHTISRSVAISSTCSDALKPGQVYYIYPTFTFYVYRVHSTAPMVIDYVNGNGWAPVDTRSEEFYKSVYDGGVVCSTIKAE